MEGVLSETVVVDGHEILATPHSFIIKYSFVSGIHFQPHEQIVLDFSHFELLEQLFEAFRVLKPHVISFQSF